MPQPYPVIYVVANPVVVCGLLDRKRSEEHLLIQSTNKSMKNDEIKVVVAFKEKSERIYSSNRLSERPPSCCLLLLLFLTSSVFVLVANPKKLKWEIRVGNVVG